MFFFFSSRRRHTRLQGDWSSDVCSSDLSIRSSVLVTAEPSPGASAANDRCTWRFACIRQPAAMPTVASSPISSTIAEARSEEHTSELQSPCNLVCRLLLEKKKTQYTDSLLVSTNNTNIDSLSRLHTTCAPMSNTSHPIAYVIAVLSQ